jgi:hypothetical protein
MERAGDARQCMDFVDSFAGKRGKGHELSDGGPEYWVNSGAHGDEFPAEFPAWLRLFFLYLLELKQ